LGTAQISWWTKFNDKSSSTREWLELKDFKNKLSNTIMLNPFNYKEEYKVIISEEGKDDLESSVITFERVNAFKGELNISLYKRT
jgi:flagellar assembly factor FliW